MSGICVAAGADAPARVRAMLARMPGKGAQHVVEAAPDLALGKSCLGALGSDTPPHRAADGAVVALCGEIFEEAGPLTDPAAAVAAHHESGSLARLAWLNGSFAAAIVDARARRIVLANDRLGTRSLFVWQSGGELAAASRLDALLADSRVRRRLSVQGLAELVAFQRTVADHTQYADIRALPAAALWRFEDGEAHLQQTRRLAWTRPDFDAREAVERLARAMRRAVRRRTADRGRHGLLLSGGLDSRWVLAAARAAGSLPSCVTAATFDNAEVAVARAVARRAGAPFRFIESAPARIAACWDAATVASDGLFAAPINLFGLLPQATSGHDVLLSGHGLDYTVRGYYLPCVMLRGPRSTTRLPRLRRIADGAPATVAANLRVGIKERALLRVLDPRLGDSLRARRLAAMTAAQANVDIDSPYDAWDAYILHCVARHYAYSDFVAMEGVVTHRTPAFDTEVFDLYLAMPPAWRAAGRIAHGAMNRLGADLMDLPDANSGVSGRHSPWAQIGAAYARAGAAKLGLGRRRPPPSPVMSHGSWANHAELLRHDETLRARIDGLARNAALLDTGAFDAAGVAEVAAAHLSRRADHAKLLMQLLTLASWFGRNGYDGVDWSG